MPTDRTVTLIAPRLDSSLVQGRPHAASSLLGRLAGRGETTALAIHAAMTPMRSGLLESLALPLDLAEGPVIAAGAGQRDGYWLCATPMHFMAGLNDLAAAPLKGAERMSADEQKQLAGALAPLLAGAGFTMLANGLDCWLIRAPRPLEVSLSSPVSAAHGLSDAMPRGADAGLLKRLMTEMQMALHEHAVNAARERNRTLAINAVWLHGGGSIRSSLERSLPPAYGHEPFLAGLYAMHGRAISSGASDAIELSQHRSSAVAAIDVESIEELEARWLSPLVKALRAGAFDALELVFGRWRVRVRRVDLWKFWRTPLEQWPS